LEEGVSGPTRMQLQQYFEKTIGSLAHRVYKTEKAFGVYDIRLNSHGEIVHFKETPQHHHTNYGVNSFSGQPSYGALHEHSRKAAIVKEAFEKAKDKKKESKKESKDKKEEKDSKPKKEFPPKDNQVSKEPGDTVSPEKDKNADLKHDKEDKIKLSGKKEKFVEDPKIEPINYMDTQGIATM